MTMIAWGADVATKNAEEALLLPPLLDMLKRRRWISETTLVHNEFAWNGRRVDVALLGKRNRTAAFELKLGSFGRALEQAMYNRLSFDRSWMVIDGVPRESSLEFAQSSGVGVIVIAQRPHVLLQARSQPVSPIVRRRLISQLEVPGK
jgi:hypothetical protein